ncbi:MAG: hypothetical protein EXR77_00545 [Myxococcales bacterium]|nr:hypothetical protein [Myxococcales bacterium]
MAHPQSSAFHQAGPALTGGRRSRRPLLRALISIAAVGAVIAAVAYACWRVIGVDLHSGTHLAANHGTGSAPSAALVLPPTAVAQTEGEATAASAAHRRTGQVALAIKPPRLKSASAADRDPLTEALIAAARDHLARKVAPTLYSVEDLRANSGNHLDLIERGMIGQLPLRRAIVRHRARNPHLYGLAFKPALTLDERKRAWNGANLEVFLRAFAQLRADNDAQAGDIAILQRTRGSRRLAAVVTEVTDDAGKPQFIVLDPGERVPTEVSQRGGYQLLRVFHFGSAQADRALQLLDLNVESAGTTL